MDLKTTPNVRYPGQDLGPDDSFRLIKLQPGNSTDPIAVHIVIARLSDPPQYEALSYAWGDITQSSEITVADGANTAPFLVTASCHAALTRLRSPSTPRTLWIDSICINQALVPERNHQLSLMPRIYSTAVQVVAYIGDRWSDEAMDWIREIDSPSDFGVTARYKDAPNVLKPNLDILRALLDRRWFHRIWVLQEITLSADAVVVCGSREVPWEAFCAFRFWNRSSSRWLDNLPYLVDTSLSRVRPIGSFQLSQPLSRRLLAKLVATRHCGATDARDKLYAILPLLEWETERWNKEDQEVDKENMADQALMPEVDYGVGPASVFTDLAMRLIDGEGLKVLREVVTGQSIEGLPSWVPDWSVCAPDTFQGQSRGAKRGRRPRSLGLGSDHLSAPNATPNLKFSTYEMASSGQRATQMHIRARLLGKILNIGDMCDIYGDYFPLDQWKSLITDPKQTTGDSQSPYPMDADWETRLRWELNTLSPFERTLAKDEIVYVDAIRVAIERIMEFNHAAEEPIEEEEARMHLRDVMKRMASSYEIQAEVIFYACHGKRFFVTDTGLIGLAPATSRVGDLVASLEGGPVPFVLRSDDSRNKDTGGTDEGAIMGLVGECYAHGVKVTKLWDDESSASGVIDIAIR